MAAAVAAMFVVAGTPTLLFVGRLAYLLKKKEGLRLKSSGQSASDASADALQQAKRSAQLVSFGVRGGAAALGWLCMVCGIWSNFVPYSAWPINLMVNMVPWPPGGALLLLAVHPSDVIGVKVATCILTGIELAFVILPLFIAQSAPAGVPLKFLPFIPMAANLCCAASNLLNCLCKGCGCDHRVPSSRVQLGRLWRSYRIFAVSMAFFFFSIGLSALGLFGPTLGDRIQMAVSHPNVTNVPGSDPADAPGALTTAVVLVLVAVGMRPAVRRKFHTMLGGLAAKGEARAAAAVAGLVGGRSAKEALKLGTDTFRGLPMSALNESDFSSSFDTGLHEKTVGAALGDVHAFLSHSWHDDAAAKWAALSGWASGQKEPVLWLDKACIDQQRIDESLAALPVYLSGCKELLIVVGPTYTRRLWCVMELFVFVQMGGSMERVTALALPGKEVQRELATFDAAQSQCFKADDRERLLGIIEGAFGDFGVFNAKVRRIFHKRSNTIELEASKKGSGDQVLPHRPPAA